MLHVLVLGWFQQAWWPQPNIALLRLACLQRTTWPVPTEPASDFGVPLANVGDVDGDGAPDLAVTACKVATAAVWVFSGRTGMALYRVPGYAHAIAELGDVDLDGRPDFVLGSDEARIVSGATGVVLRSIREPEILGRGAMVAGMGDLDGDGVPDLVVAGQEAFQVHSGRTGARLWASEAPTYFRSCARRWVSCVDDANDDGKLDLVVMGRRDVALHSGADGSLLRRMPYVHGLLDNLCTIGAAGDFDRDGRGDFVMTYPDVCATVVSGRDGKILREFEQLLPGGYCEGFGASVTVLGDVNGDGVDDVAVGCADAFDVDDRYYTAVFSGRDAALLHGFWGEPEVPGHYQWVANAGDIDGDGVMELAVGMPQLGVVHIVSCKTWSILRTLCEPKREPSPWIVPRSVDNPPR